MTKKRFFDFELTDLISSGGAKYRQGRDGESEACTESAKKESESFWVKNRPPFCHTAKGSIKNAGYNKRIIDMYVIYNQENFFGCD